MSLGDNFTAPHGSPPPSTGRLNSPAAPVRREHWFPLAHRPLLVLCIAFLAGIWLGSKSSMSLALWVAAALLAVLAVVFLRRHWMALLGSMIGALACGCLVFALYSVPPCDDVRLVVPIGETVHLEGYLLAQLPSHTETAQYLLRAVRLRTGHGCRYVSGRVLVRVAGDERALPGSAVQCQGIFSKPRPVGNPGQFDLAAALTRNNVHVLLQANYLAPTVQLPLAVAHRVRRAAAAFREMMVSKLRACMPGPYPEQYTELLAAIVYGAEVSPVPQLWAQAARETGTIHLLVVSGAQITLLSGLVVALCSPQRSSVGRWLKARLRGHSPTRMVPPVRWWQAVMVVGVVCFFSLMVGTGVSVSRALIMAILGIFAAVFDYDYDPYTALGVAGAVICALDPAAIFSTSAQLSFAATLGVLLALRSLPFQVDTLKPFPRVMVVGLAALVGVWLLLTPLLAYHFSAFPMLGALANLAAVPLCGVAMVLTLIGMPLCFISERLAAMALYPARWVIEGLLTTNEVFRALPWAYRSDVHFGAATCVAWYVGLALIAVLHRTRGNWREWMTPKRCVAAVLLVAACLSIWFAVRANAPERLVVTVLDVGHGQCCVVRATSGRTIMVDAGSGETLTSGRRCAREVILPFLLTRHIRRIDAIVITHPDADHCNAVPTVLESVPVGVILESFSPHSSETYERVKAAAAAAGVPCIRASAGGVLNLSGSARAYVLWPTGTPSDEAYDDNDRSIVLRITHGRVSALLPADIGVNVENQLLRREVPLQADILVVGHHGSSGSSGWRFLQAVNPSLAVVSCAPDDADHPSALVQSRLRSLGVELWRTDRDGAVSIMSDGRGIRVKGHRSRRCFQTRSAVWRDAFARASNIASGSSPAISMISVGSFGRNAARMRWLIATRTSGDSSDRRARKRSRVVRSSGDIVRATGLRRDVRWSEALSVGSERKTVSGSSLRRSLTTTVPAARSPSRLLLSSRNATSAPVK